MDSDYDDQRFKTAAAALKTFHVYGPERSLQRYLGAIDALQYAIFSIRGGGFTGTLVINNTKPVELPCDVGPAA